MCLKILQEAKLIYIENNLASMSAVLFSFKLFQKRKFEWLEKNWKLKIDLSKTIEHWKYQTVKLSGILPLGLWNKKIKLKVTQWLFWLRNILKEKKIYLKRCFELKKVKSNPMIVLVMEYTEGKRKKRKIYLRDVLKWN